MVVGRIIVAEQNPVLVIASRSLPSQPVVLTVHLTIVLPAVYVSCCVHVGTSGAWADYAVTFCVSVSIARKATDLLCVLSGLLFTLHLIPGAVLTSPPGRIRQFAEFDEFVQAAASLHALCHRGALAAPAPPQHNPQPCPNPPHAAPGFCQWQSHSTEWAQLPPVHHDAAIPGASRVVAESQG